MNKVSSLVSPFLILFGVLFSQDCAAITRSRTQRIPVTSSPAGATVSIDGVKQGVTPMAIRLERKWKGQVIRIECPGYHPVEIQPERRLSGGPILGNFILGIVVGMVPAMAYGFGGPLFEPKQEARQREATSLLIWGLSAAAFGGVFTLIDTGGGGKGYNLSPKDLTVTLTKADGTPRVDTLLVDPDELRNVKWIRVRLN